MIWSISGYKQYRKCPRQWYYKNIVADGRVKNNAFRKEVTVLSRLQSLEAWRGSIVDNVISRLLVNAINKKMPIQKAYYIQQADEIFNRQLIYAKEKRYRSEGEEAKTTNPDFAAFFDVELGNGIREEDVKRVRADMHDALDNFFEDKSFIEYLQSGKLLVSQRQLTYYFDRFTVRGTPDLIIFFHDKAPHIFDWKVHTFGTYTYDEQLISYAIALYKVTATKPHQDFPAGLSNYKLADYSLTEYQLLHKDRIRRDYTITNDAVEDFTDKVSKSIIEMYLTGAHKKFGEVSEERFDTTSHIENCRTCAFQLICKNSTDEIRN